VESKDAGQKSRRAGQEAQPSKPDGCKQRLSYGVFPKPMSGAVPYANSREELAGISLGEKVRLVMSTPAWDEVLRPLLTGLDENRPKRGPAPAYSSEELESCLLYQRLAGASTYGRARTLLAGDRGEADRIALGFDRSRQRVGAGLRLIRSLDGVPSEVTVWRHKQRFGLDEHVAAYRTLFERLVRDHFEEFPELAEESRLVHWDGSILLSHYSSDERLNKETGELKPPTLTGGGYRPRTKDNAGKDGHGFNLISAVTQTGLPLGARLTPINDGEAKTARRILEGEWREIVAPYLRDDLVRVMACDAAYSGPLFREAIHRAGFIPNCHPVSHGNRARSIATAKKRDDARLKIRYHEKWHLNGHHELACECGQGKVMRRARKKRNGEAVASLEGSCPNCKSVSLTTGRWRRVGNIKTGNSVAKTLHDEQSESDWRIGNPLTYNDKLSDQYGSARFGQHEGWHGALVSRFGLLKDKAWYRDARDAERDLLQVFCVMHSLAMEQRRRAASAGTRPSTPLAGACRAQAPPLARAA
jgi:hypothetical protein